jgi:phenylpropionate dioxygenase-like ring-hydroxylating dioxygenase large terminal subunit
MTKEQTSPAMAQVNHWTNPPLRNVPISGERYTSTDFMAGEWEHIWTKVWLILGRASEMPQAGDYQMEEIGKE